MYIIVNNNNNIILNIDTALDYLSNGYPRLINKDIAFVKDFVTVYEKEEIPFNFIPDKYCYTEADGFYINPNYIEPDATNTYGIPDDTYHQILDDYTIQLIEEGVIVWELL